MQVRIALFIMTFLVAAAAPAEASALQAPQPVAAQPGAAREGIAGMYFWGWGVKRDYAQAMKLWRAAADRGDATAPFNIGAMYQDGWGVKRDYAEAVKWYLRAASLGNPNAQRNIGQVYAGGFGVSQDPVEAAKWYRKAADQGDYIAQFSLGGMYERGEGGLKQDYVQAYMWLSLAATAKKDAKYDTNLVETFDASILAYAARQRDALAAKMTPQQIEEAKRLAAASRPVPSQGAVPAASAAEVIENARVAFDVHDYQTATRLLLPLAGQGNAEAQEKLGTLYAGGQDGVNQNYGEALKWYLTAADRGNARARTDIGWMHENGWGTPRDRQEALKWYRKAADEGDYVAQRIVGQAYASGRDAKQDYAEAAKWYQKAAAQGDYIAQFSLGGMYAGGQGGLTQDNVQAYMWLSLAAAEKRDSTRYDLTIVDNYDDSVVWYATKQRDALAAKMTPAQIAEAQRLAAGRAPPPKPEQGGR